MRIWERLSYLFGIGLAITYGLEEYLASLILLSLTGLSLLIGAFVEGFRFPQWVFIIAFVSQIVLVVLAVFSIIALCIYCVFLAYAITVNFIFGENNMDKFKVYGPYEVGYKKIYTQQDGLTVHVYYPMEREKHAELIGEKGRNPGWLVDGSESREGVAKATANWGTEDNAHPWMFKYLEGATLNVVSEGPIAKDFEKRALVPIVYVHGLTCTGLSQSGSCRDFASHGYIVFALDHFDGTCYYSKKKSGEVKLWSSMEPWGEKSHLQKKLSQRKNEISQLIDDICSPKFVTQTLEMDSSIQLDLSRLVLGGHSFGGLTTVAVANEDQRVKAIFGLDAFLWPIIEDIQESRVMINKPQIHIITEGFEPRIEHYFEYSTIGELRSLICKSQ